MQNAFELLGATPLDNNEKLQELFEEKQLLLDNDKELAEAYSALTNPKKRIKHEIEYFAKEEFEPFNKIFVENADSEQKMNLHDTCSAIINLGRWFDADINDIYTQINDNREISGFSKLSNSGTVSTAISEMRANCVNSVTKYFEFIDEKGLVKLFNELVEYEDFTSFFMDELMAHYEIKIKDSLQKKEKLCTSKFEEVERRCNTFNNGGVFSIELDEKVSEFKKALTSWDKLAQPLQVNAQQHGATHEGSITIVRNIRNKVIDLSNESQESLTKTLQSVQYSYNAKETFTQKLADSVTFTDIIIKLLDILKSAFAEDELTADRLKKDKQDITKLKKSLQELLNKFDPYGRYKTSTAVQQPKSSYAPSQHTPSRSTGSYGSSGKKGVIVAMIIIGILILISIISGIVNSANRDDSSNPSESYGTKITVNVKAGSSGRVGFKVNSSTYIYSVGSYDTALYNSSGTKLDDDSGDGNNFRYYATSGTIYYAGSYQDKAMNYEIRSTNYTIFTITSGGSSSTTYNLTLDKDGGSGGTSSVVCTIGQSMPYATAPTRSGYTFKGYYYSRNGVGSQYYNSSMTSMRSWSSSDVGPLYAYWEEDGITLTTSNFSTYFNLSSSCSIRTSTIGYTTYYYADYTYSITPKSTLNRYLSSNPSSISVTIGIDVSSISSSYGTPSRFKVYITLYKSSGYSNSGSQSFSISSIDKYWRDGCYSISGTVYG